MRALLIAYDNGSYIHNFPLGLAYVARTMEDQGIDVDIYSQDMHHWPEKHLTEHLKINSYDIVGVSFVAGYYQYGKMKKIAAAIHASESNPCFILGGHGPAADPEYFLKLLQADIVVVGEGESTTIELLDVMSRKASLSSVEGIAYREGDEVFINPRRVLIQDIDALPYPAYHKFPIDYYRLIREVHCKPSDFVMSILSGRGCPFKCNFCYRMDEGCRIRSDEAILEEVKFLKREYDINYIVFADELLMTSESRTISLCESMIRDKLNIRWICNGRLNFAKPEVLRLMKEAGCVYVNYGIESLDNETLTIMRKGLTVSRIIAGVEATLEAGISPGLNIIFGNIGETKEMLERGVDFLIKYEDQALLRTVRPVTPYPGSELFRIAIEKGLIKDTADFYENKHVNSDLLCVNFTPLTDNDFYDALFGANERLIKHYCKKNEELLLNQARKLYLEKSANDFRGFRHT